MLTDGISLLDSFEKVMYVAVAGDATKRFTEEDLCDDINCQKLDPFTDIKSSELSWLRYPLLIDLTKPIEELLIDNRLHGTNSLVAVLSSLT